MKKCSICNKLRNDNDFYFRWDRLCYRKDCKDCIKLRSRGYRGQHLEYYKGYNKEYFIANREHLNKKQLAYYHKMKIIFHQKYRARDLLHDAINRGQVQKRNCEICLEDKVQGHHSDYTNSLDVLWLCERCHKLLHSKIG